MPWANSKSGMCRPSLECGEYARALGKILGRFIFVRSVLTNPDCSSYISAGSGDDVGSEKAICG